MKGRKWQEDRVFSCGEARETTLNEVLHAEGRNFSALVVLARNGMNPTRPALCYHTAILRRLSDKMKLLKFLCLPKGHRRARSVARSEIGPIEGQGGADLAVLRPTESAPDLRIGTSTLPKPGPLIHRNQESDGMQIVLSRTIRLNASLCVIQTPTPFPIELCPFPEVTRAAFRDPQVMPLTR